jgi:hypothetical protein
MPGRLYGAAAEYVAKTYDGGMAETETSESIGTSVAQVFGNDPERVFVLLVNLSANTIYVSFDTNVSSTNGILLAANGGSLEMDVRSDLIFPIRAIYALAAGAGSMLYVLTMRRDFAPPPPVA